MLHQRFHNDIERLGPREIREIPENAVSFVTVSFRDLNRNFSSTGKRPGEGYASRPTASGSPVTFPDKNSRRNSAFENFANKARVSWSTIWIFKAS